jgi:predicted MFS family arabinose efflux permease
LAASFLFNLGQGVLRPALPLYLQRTFAANYRMVTLIPVVFGAGKWIANVPTGYLLTRWARSLMVTGLALIAFVDVTSAVTARFDLFLVLRGLGGVGWAMFATVATAATVSSPGREHRGRSVSLLLMSETSGLLVGTAAGGWLYQRLGVVSPFLFEAACMLVAAVTASRGVILAGRSRPSGRRTKDRRRMLTVLRTPGVVLTGVTSALLTGLQTGVLVFLFPLYLLTRGGLGPEAVGGVVSLTVLGRLVSLWIGGAISDRWGRLRVLIPGLLVYAVALAATAQLSQPLLLAVGSFTLGAIGGGVAPIPTALTSDLVEESLHGVAIGWLRTMSDTGQVAGPLVMGAVADLVDLAAPFVCGAALLVVAACCCRFRAHAMTVAGDARKS